MRNLPLEIWVLLGGLLLVAGFMWLMFTEWSYLGSKFVRRSYDWMVPWYEGKWKSEAYRSDDTNRKLFVVPILRTCRDSSAARVLDLACGTGRGSLLLLNQSEFKGDIDAVDFSAGMLQRFRDHLSDLNESQSARVNLTELDLKKWQPAKPKCYDAVLFLEAAELIPDLPSLVENVFAALKPGGVLITTQVGRRYVWLFRGRHQKNGGMRKLLVEKGFEIIEVVPWRPRYDVMVAVRKSD